MAQCEVVYPVPSALPAPAARPRVVVQCADGLPQSFFSRDRAIAIFKAGGPTRQLGGLINVGYSCYMNAVIQCLAYTPGFARFCLSMPNAMYQVNQDSAFFLDAFGHVFEQMEANKSACPDWFIQDAPLLSDRFRGPIQQDAHEFLVDLIDRFNTECLRAMKTQCSGETVISHLFNGTIHSEFYCEDCKKIERKDSQFSDLTIPITSFGNLQDAIDAMTSEEVVKVACECGNCGCEAVTRRNAVTRYPLVMIVTLMRFDNQLRKIEDFFEFPDVLYVRNGEVQYQLYAMIVHEGRVISHGHFYANVRDENGTWYKADDVCVYKAKTEVVMESRPYLLFYRRVV